MNLYHAKETKIVPLFTEQNELGFFIFLVLIIIVGSRSSLLIWSRAKIPI